MTTTERLSAWGFTPATVGGLLGWLRRDETEGVVPFSEFVLNTWDRNVLATDADTVALWSWEGEYAPIHTARPDLTMTLGDLVHRAAGCRCNVTLYGREGCAGTACHHYSDDNGCHTYQSK